MLKIEMTIVFCLCGEVVGKSKVLPLVYRSCRGCAEPNTIKFCGSPTPGIELNSFLPKLSFIYRSRHCRASVEQNDFYLVRHDQGMTYKVRLTRGGQVCTF